MLVLAAKSLKTCSKPMIEKCSPKLLEIVWVLAKVQVLCQFYFGKFSLFLCYYYLDYQYVVKATNYHACANITHVLYYFKPLFCVVKLQLKYDIKKLSYFYKVWGVWHSFNCSAGCILAHKHTVIALFIFFYSTSFWSL